MPWLELTFETTSKHADILSDALSEVGAAAVTLTDAKDQPIFEPRPGAVDIWPDTNITGLFESGEDIDAILEQLKKQLGEVPRYRVSPLEDRDWIRAWMDDYRPMKFGKNLYVVPLTMDPPNPNAVNLRLDPGLAFGTGTHPTTALCLEWLDHQDLTGKTIIDYGCGSGVLAVAALLLGADRAIGIDNDPQALIATRSNAQVNQVAERMEVYLPDDAPDSQGDVLIANILASPLISLAPNIYGRMKPHATFALSGILEPQAKQVIDAYTEHCQFDPNTEKQGWMRLSGTRK